MRSKCTSVYVGILVLGLGYALSAHGNLILNPSFEDGGPLGSLPDATITNWTHWDAGWYTDNPIEVFDGDRAIVRWMAGTGMFQDFAADADVTYEFSLWALDRDNEPMNTDSRLQLSVEWLDGSFAVIGSTVPLDSLVGGGDNTWTELTGSDTAPVGTVWGRYLITTETTGTWDGNVMFDQASVIPEPGTFLLLALGGLALTARRRLKK